MSTQSLLDRVVSLSEGHKSTQSLISRLADPLIRSDSGLWNAEDADAQAELSAEIHQSLKDQEEQLELLQQEIDVFNTRQRVGGQEKEKSLLKAHSLRLAEELKRCCPLGYLVWLQLLILARE